MGKIIWACVLVLLLGAWWSEGAYVLEPESVSGFFVEPDRETVIPFWAEGGSDGDSVDFVIRNYAGEERYRSSAVIEDERLEIAFGEEKGYHELYFPRTEQVFGIGVAPVFRGESDPFFALDAAMSWFVEGNRREGMIASIARSGIGTVRERLDWPVINPEPGQWHWHRRGPDDVRFAGVYEGLRLLYNQHGIDVLEQFHTTPHWARTGRASHAYPDDLAGTAEAWRAVGGRWHSYWAGLEAWQGVDDSYGRYVPADQYVPLVRALRYAIEDTRLAIPLGGGGFFRFNRSYLDLAARNGLLDLVDYVSFHFRGDPHLMAHTVASYRSWLADYGRESMPLWITEGVVSWEAPVREARPETDTAKEVASRQTMNAIEAKAAGVERYFASLYPALAREGRGIGMTDEHGSPLRSLAGYFQAVRLLSHKEYAGDLELNTPAVSRARVFKDAEGNAVVVLYNGRPHWSQTVTLPFDLNAAEGIDGRELPLVAAGRGIGMRDGLVYLLADAEDVEPHLVENAYADVSGTVTGNPAPSPSQVSSIILQPAFDTGTDISATQAGYVVSHGAESVSVPVWVHNLSGEHAEVEVVLRDRLADNDAVLDEELVTVSPGGRAEAVLTLAPASLSADAGKASVAVEARNAGDASAEVPGLVFDLILPRDLETVVAGFEERRDLSLSDLERRLTVSSANTTRGITMIITREGHWRMSGGFADAGSSSVSLNLEFPGGIDWSNIEAILVRARFEHAMMSEMRVWTDFGTSHQAVNRPIARDGEWGVYLYALNTDHFHTEDDLEPDQIRRFEDGLRPLDRMVLELIHLDSDEDQNRIEISDIILLGGRR